MGTNYYLNVKPGLFRQLQEADPNEQLHIGKSSGGWCFALHIYPDRNINCLRDWYRLFVRDKNFIIDEYDRIITVEEMIDTIVNRKWPHQRQFPTKDYENEKQFLRLNNAEMGPNNLLRAKPNAFYCVGPGKGTYDLFKGDFS